MSKPCEHYPTHLQGRLGGFHIELSAPSSCNCLIGQPMFSAENDIGDNSTIFTPSPFTLNQSNTLFIPYGKYPHSVGLQIFDRESAQLMKSAFNDAAPAYFGHPDVPGRPDSNPAAPARGWVQGINVGDAGMTLPMKWGKEGREAINNAHFRFYSPLWDLRRISGGVQPVRLKSIGLTNNPRIPVPPIANDSSGSAAANDAANKLRSDQRRMEVHEQLNAVDIRIAPEERYSIAFNRAATKCPSLFR